MTRLALLSMVGLMVALTAACSTTVPVTVAGPRPSLGLRSVYGMGSERPAKVVLEDRAFEARRLRPNGSTIVLLGHDGDSVVVVPEELLEVSFREPGRGLLEGAALGALVALAAGIDSAIFHPESELCNRLCAGVVGTLAIGAISVPLGAVLGLGIGHRTRFVFER